MAPVSINPANANEGGGLWDNLDVRWVNPRFVSNWDYGGKSKPVTAFVVDLIDLADGQQMEPQAWSCGNEVQASKDGNTPAESGDFLCGTAIRKSTNFIVLMDSLAIATPDNLKERMLKEVMETNRASSLEGLECHMVRKIVERKGLKKEVKINPNTGKAYEETGTPVVDVVLRFPWDKARKTPPGAKAAAPAPAAGKAAPAPAATGKAAPPPRTGKAAPAPKADYDAIAIEAVRNIMASNPDGLLKDDLLGEVYKAISVPKDRQAVLDLLYDDAWLTANGTAENGFEFVAENNAVYPAA